MPIIGVLRGLRVFIGQTNINEDVPSVIASVTWNRERVL